MAEIEFTIPRRCPSVHGDSVGERLREWRALICDELRAQGVLCATYDTSEEAIRKVVREHMDGPCGLEAQFWLRATKRVTDLDNVFSFIMTCFRTELSAEASEIERAFGTRPWFYYEAFDYPGALDFWQVRARRYDGQPEDLTRVRIR